MQRALQETLLKSEFPACLPQAGDTRICRPRSNNLAIRQVAAPRYYARSLNHPILQSQSSHSLKFF